MDLGLRQSDVAVSIGVGTDGELWDERALHSRGPVHAGDHGISGTMPLWAADRPVSWSAQSSSNRRRPEHKGLAAHELRAATNVSPPVGARRKLREQRLRD